MAVAAPSKNTAATKKTTYGKTAARRVVRRTPMVKKPLPAGLPREWYEAHNRRLKAMRLAIALLDGGVYTPERARNRTIRTTAARIGVHPPSNTTCRMVRSLIIENAR
ncbi:hypothetical protein DF17_08980 [Streptomyces rimosus]|uniref:Integrase n=1 Tax=Streptomyces rimosus subsp. rimosus TaxID=132474 RepID=A0ABY3ZA30_STRRM|nr:hypothetical protein DF17_08980 [Streptomyces rimosus]KEF20314.1 hypothetical protein DF18_11700 [Streptomyces rimosus]UNZ06390.1 hypothetical protein SRIMR7_29990 [Streptomyces rimosus subsp. rimosus]UTH97846.1 hypothetical protein SRIMHP_27365 [Streptomyces rimosus subsp. rimosus]UTJ15944.1 hypothetical protein SRIMDV3_27265 [Streptomyces rimosus subsp. rimosus]